MMETIYLDYNATTPIREEVLELMDRVARECFGNPSSAHLLGRMSKSCLEEARRKVAEAIGADADEIVFTNGGSESDNLAIKGVALQRSGGHIVTTCIEHSAVRKTCDFLKTRGFEVSCLPVDRGGCVDPQIIRDAIRDDTFLITVMWANNEAGQIQPVEEIADIARGHKILFHTDAVQAFGKLPVNVKQVPVDLLSISAHKFYGPKGVGALYIRGGIDVMPEIHGGGQEMGIRAGTENIIGCAAMGEACRLAIIDIDTHMPRLRKLRDKLEAGILAVVADARVSGDTERRVPNTTNISFNGLRANRLIQKLDEVGIAVSGASACASVSAEPSSVLMQGMGLSREEAIGAIRMSLGKYTQPEDVDRVLQVLPGFVQELRDAAESRRTP